MENNYIPNNKPKKTLKLKFDRKKMLVIVTILIICYLGIILASKRYSIVEYENERIRLEAELEEKEKEIEELKELIKNAQDLKFIEKMARESLKMVKPNETVYIVNK